MRSSIISASAAVLLSGLASAQTYTDCNPLTNTTCPSDPALGGLQVTDFTAGNSSNWELASGTTLSYSDTLGAEFVISAAGEAPTISNTKYIMFGRIEVWTRAAAGTGIVSSFILESDDLDEIDWEWLGYNDTIVENNFFGKGNTTTYNRAQYPTVSTPIETFHNYTIDWTAASIIWYIDGVAVRTLAYDDALALYGKNYPQTPMRVKMGSWIGCADTAAETDSATEGTCEWAGGAVDLTAGPFTMYVKNVTIQDYGCATEYTYGDQTGDYTSIESTGGCSNTTSSSSSSESSTATASGSSESSTATASGSSTKATGAAAANATVSGAAVSSSTSSSTVAQATTSDGNSLKKPKHEYGMLDLGVMALGLGLGYLVM